jgi:hypothetical protein
LNFVFFTDSVSEFYGQRMRDKRIKNENMSNGNDFKISLYSVTLLCISFNLFIPFLE